VIRFWRKSEHAYYFKTTQKSYSGDPDRGKFPGGPKAQQIGEKNSTFLGI
jgi:hypothetical protein